MVAMVYIPEQYAKAVAKLKGSVQSILKAELSYFFRNFFVWIWQWGMATTVIWVTGEEGLAAGDAEPPVAIPN